MRQPLYISPSSLMKYKENPDRYYLDYLCEMRPPKFIQTEPMAVGSSFDAYIKAHLAKILWMDDPELELDYLLDTQIEQHREFAEDAGKKCFDLYSKSPAYDLLVQELKEASVVKFEADEYGTVCGVPFRVKPDLSYIRGKRVVVDWKVNGYCSKYKRSPAKGYIDCDGVVHKKAHLVECNLMDINDAVRMEDVDSKWALQLAIGNWVLGEDIGFQNPVGIDQLVCFEGDIRVARHRCLIGEEFQEAMFAQAFELWDNIQNGNIFHWRSDAQSHMEHLDRMASVYHSTNELDIWMLANI